MPCQYYLILIIHNDNIINNTLEISNMLNMSHNCEYNPVNYSVLADTVIFYAQ